MLHEYGCSCSVTKSAGDLLCYLSLPWVTRRLIMVQHGCQSVYNWAVLHFVSEQHAVNEHSSQSAWLGASCAIHQPAVDDCSSSRHWKGDGCLMAGLSHLCKQKIHLTSFVPCSSGELSKTQGYKGRYICCPHSSMIGLIRKEQKRPLLFAGVCVGCLVVCVHVLATGPHTYRGWYRFRFACSNVALGGPDPKLSCLKFTLFWNKYVQI